MGDEAIGELADKLFRAKRRVYRRSLLELALSLGLNITRPQLSDEITDELHKEADRNARRIAGTYNRDLADAARRYTGPASQLEDSLRTWAKSRQRKRAKPTAITETYSAHADAMLSAARDLGIESPHFDFGGQPSDDPPECEICQVLMATNPHPLDFVIEIGNPHVACRQDWHLSGYDQREFPSEPRLGRTPGGLTGSDTWLQRHGNDRQAAVRAIETAVAER